MVGGHFEKVPFAIPPSPITAFLEGPGHSLWIAAWGYGVFRLQDGTLTSFTIQDGLPANRVNALYRDYAGRMWTAGSKGISFWNGTRFLVDSAVNALLTESEVISCTEDRDGNLWIASSSGLFRVHGDEVSRMDRSTGLSGDFANDIFEDREGNLWVGTRSGLDRFRDQQVRLFSQPNGPIVADNGAVWTASNKQITRIGADTIRTWPLSLPARSITHTLLSEPDAGFLIGFDNGVGSWTSEHSPLASELSRLDVVSLLRAHDGGLWIGTSNRGLLRWKPSEGSQGLTETGLPDRFITTLAEDRTGAIWAGSNAGGGLYRLSSGNVQHFGRDQGLPAPEIYTIFVDGKDQIWIGSTGGLSWFQGGRIRTLNSQRGLPADQVFAILDDSYDRLWFTGFAGISAIDKKSLTDWAAGRRPNVNPLLYRSAQGLQVRTVGNVFPNCARTPDGHLWFSIADGLVEVTPPDPAASHPPQFPVLVEDVTVDGIPHTQFGRIQMPPGTRSVELRYTALTLSDAEAVRFRYRLEGVDNDWVYADTRRIAFYNNLKPGDYKFRIAARVGEEQWQESSALALEQLPFFYQTWWFMVLGSLAALSLVLFVYRLRVSQAVDRIQAGFQQRIDERTRIARDLHDTLLQSFQASLIQMQRARNHFSRSPEEAIRTLDTAIGSAGQAIAEGRDAIQDLRPTRTPQSDLEHLLNVAGQELAEANANGTPPAFRVTVEGSHRSLSPIVHDEIYRIGRELLRNAFRHAQASRIEAEIRYDNRKLRLRIRDDGRGIDREIMAEGARAGHWGLPGARERATQIGARLDFWSEAGAGTEVELTVPASTAYAKSQAPRPSAAFREKDVL
jgi:signal transduction histidine kinase/ligand-binding sensor domain-containing protein